MRKNIFKILALSAILGGCVYGLHYFQFITLNRPEHTAAEFGFASGGLIFLAAAIRQAFFGLMKWAVGLGFGAALLPLTIAALTTLGLTGRNFWVNLGEWTSVQINSIFGYAPAEYCTKYLTCGMDLGANLGQGVVLGLCFGGFMATWSVTRRTT